MSKATDAAKEYSDEFTMSRGEYWYTLNDAQIELLWTAAKIEALKEIDAKLTGDSK